MSNASPATPIDPAASGPHLTGPTVSDPLDLGPAARDYFAALRDGARRKNRGAEGRSLEELEAQRSEIGRREAAGELVDVAMAEATIAEHVAALRAEFSAMPTACTDDPELRARMEQVSNAAFERVRIGLTELAKRVRSACPQAAEDEAEDGEG